MRRFIVPVALFALTFAVVGASSAIVQGPSKFAYINSDLIMSQAPGLAQIEADLKKVLDPLEKRMRAMQDSNAALVAEYRKTEATLTPAARLERTESYEKRSAGWTVEAEQIQQKVMDARAAASRPLMQLFKTVIDEIRAEDGYTFIFDVGGEGQGIVAADKNLDISDKVLARLRTAAAKAAASKPAAAPTGPARGPVGTGTNPVRPTTPPPTPPPPAR
jgi:outer membrane protein